MSTSMQFRVPGLRRLLSAAAFWLPLASAAQINLSGNVRTEDGIFPEMITVYAYPVGGSKVEVRHTDAEGNYTFLLANGIWVVQADPSYASWWQPDVHKYAMYREEYYNNQFFYTDATRFDMAPGMVHTGINFVLERYTEIKGRVLHASNQQPLGGIPISASCKDGTGISSGYLQTTTDTNGLFSLYVNVGQWQVYASPEGLGFAGQYWSNKTGIASADLIHVENLGEPAHSNINFNLQPVQYGKMSGHVFGPGGTPVPYAQVYLSGNNSYMDPFFANSEGYWEKTTLLPDTYLASVYQYPYPTQYYCQQHDQGTAHRITVVAGADIRDIDFHLLEPSRISGTVRNKAGDPISSAYVGFSSADGGWGGANAAGDGTYLIEQLPPGHYRLYASAATYLQTWYSNRTGEASADRVVLEAGQTVSNIHFELDAGGAIAGVVSNTSGSYAGGVQVMATPAQVDLYSAGWIEHYTDYSGSYDGRFRVQGIPRGPCVIQSMDVSYMRTAGAYYDLKFAHEEADILDLTNTNLIEGIVLYSYNEAKLSGRITAAAGGASLVYVTVYVLTTNGHEVSHGESDENGNYNCPSLAPGTYVVLAAPMFTNEEYGHNFAPRYYGGSSSLELAARVTLTEGMNQSGINIALATASGGISGKVARASDGIPIQGHSIYVWSTGHPVVKLGSASTDAGGNYLVRGLSPGTYRVQAWPNNFGALQFYNGKTNYASADNVIVGSSIVGGIHFQLDEIIPGPYAPGMRKPLPPVWQSPVAFEWMAIEGARFYELRVDDLTAGVTGVLQQAGITDTNHIASFSFTPNHRYRAQVRAGNSAGYGEYGPPMPFIYLPPPQHNLIIVTNGPGVITLDPPGGSYTQGTVVALTAVETNGSTFDHWSGVDSPPHQPSSVVTVITERTVTAFFLANRPPVTPVAISPGDGVTVDLSTAVLEAGAFADPDPDDILGASHFVVYQVEGVPLAESDTNGVPGTTFALVDPALQGNSSYHWKVRYADGHGLWSDWSSSADFSTSNRPPLAPLCLVPSNHGQASINTLLRGNLFQDPDTADSHSATLWQIADASGDFGNPVYGIETPGAVIHIPPQGTLTYSNYVWRLRYRDNHSDWSAWSLPAAFSAVPTIDDMDNPPSGVVTITWPTDSGFLYTLYRSPALMNGTWSIVPGYSNAPGTGSLMSYHEPAGQTGSLYYCIMVGPED